MVFSWEYLAETLPENYATPVPGETKYEIYRRDPEDMDTGVYVTLPRVTVQQRIDIVKREMNGIVKGETPWEETLLMILANVCQDWPEKGDYVEDELLWPVVQKLYDDLNVSQKIEMMIKPGHENTIGDQQIFVLRAFYGIKRRVGQLGKYGPEPIDVLDDKGEPTGKKVDLRTMEVKEGDKTGYVYWVDDIESPNHIYRMRFAQYCEMVKDPPKNMGELYEDVMTAVLNGFFTKLK